MPLYITSILIIIVAVLLVVLPPVGLAALVGGPVWALLARRRRLAYIADTRAEHVRVWGF